MAVLDVKVPQLSESVTEATLLQWHKHVGEAVVTDENLVDIETDKVVLELPSPGNGVLVSIRKQDGDTVMADEIIATIDTEAVASVVPEKTPDETPVSGVAQAGQTASPATPGEADAEPVASTGPVASDDRATPQDDLPSADAYPAGIVMPAAARMLAETGLSPDAVSGTGRGGRVTKDDVRRAVETPAGLSGHTQQKAGETAQDRREDRVPMSRLRARVAERLIASQQSTASLTTFNEVNMQAVLDVRRKFGEAFEKTHGVRLGFMSFFVKAAIAALKRFPVVNASIDGNDIVYHGYYDIGIAISSPRGLVVPILRDADLMTIAEIEKAIHALSVKARDGQLTLDDLTGGTFSISNGGVFGSMLSTPIINPPQSAILGIHATTERPVVENGQIVIRPMNYLALSYDHRLIDGREAVLALRTIKETLEDPARLLLDL